MQAISMIRRRRSERRGATVLELSFILFWFLVLTMGMLDLGVGVFRYHIISQAARYGARRAVVHGSMATALGSWGPSSTNATGTDTGTAIVDGSEDGIAGMLTGCDLASTTIDVEWLNGSNAFGEPVRVTVTSPYTPIFLYIFPGGTINLTASSTMAIAH